MSETTRTVERCIRIEAPREEVYQALLDPAALSRWMYATVRIQPREGGAYRIEWQDTKLPAAAQGEILEMVDGRRLVLSWFMERDGIQTVATFELEDEDGATHLKFRHAGFPGDPDWRSRFEMVATEWDKTLENLRFLLEEREGDAPLFYHRFQVELPASRERAHLHWMAPAALRTWLTRTAWIDPAVGGTFDLLLKEGSQVTGTIRAFVPGKHLRVLWEEDGVRSLLGISFWPAPEGCVMTLTQRSYALAEADRPRLVGLWEERFARLREGLARRPGSWERGGERRMEFSRTLAAGRPRVWKAWTDPGSLVAWFCDRAEFTASPEHDYAFLWTGFGEARGRVLAVDPERRLCLAWEHPALQRTSEVEIRLEDAKDRAEKTRLLVAHGGWGEGKDWSPEWAAHRFGWESFLALLDFYLKERERGPARSFLLRRKSDLSVEEIWSRFSNPEGLRTWLGEEGSIEPHEGGRFRIKLGDGSLWIGRVAVADPKQGLALRIESPEPVYLEFGWEEDSEGSRLLLAGRSYGAPESWPLQQRILWAERFAKLTRKAKQTS
ncbi:MAG: hypothetical protein GF346_13735 [Candidatus Eisenbacteria bacterium]|nr:hypothetical protein [Candidatus Latescibacterota bacterium]MBD3303502.1 hypothetical protein [Candidatus Eisenbacteria bacterium]